MNWQQIKTEYPLAFSKLKSQYTGYEFKNFTGWEAIIDQHEHQEFPIRLLYDFFDDLDIFVSVYRKEAFYVSLHYRQHEFIKDLNPLLPGRRSAESYVFKIAFRLLNDQIGEGIIKA